VTGPAVAVVIPAFGQAALLPEAIVAALAQPEAVTVVVDDGCAQPGTRAAATAFAAAHPGRVFALSQPNGGLAAARDTGINFALAAFPSVEALFFLDADNRLYPGALGRWLAALRAASPETGWLYPDIDELGGEASWSTAGAFSRLALLAENYCEAGSLVRRAVFEGGLRFDPGLRAGWEDWDFFLAAMGQGWVGQHHPTAGLRYRRRPESLLRAADRQAPVLLAALHAKHAAQRTPRALLALAAAEAPILALHQAGGGEVTLHVDPVAAPVARLAPTAARTAFLASEATPSAVHFPGVLAFTENAAWVALTGHGLLRGVVSRSMVLLRTNPAVAVTLAAGGDALGTRVGAATKMEAPLLLVRRDLLEAAGESALEALGPTVPALLVTLPAAPPAAGLAGRQLALEAAALRHERRRAAARPTGWRSEFRAPRHTALARVLGAAGIGAILPAAPGPRTIAFVVPLFALGGVEQVVLAQARVLRARGWRTRLVVLGRTEAISAAALAAAFDDIVCAAGLGDDAASSARYFAAPVTGFADTPGFADALGLFADCDVLVATHSDAAQALFAPLRRLGVRVWAALHLTGQDAWGAPQGKPEALLGHEHALDGVTVISERLRGEALALGFPADKLCLVRNAPSIVAAPRPPRGQRLRALFLGRLDAQKGLDRLAAIVTATRCEAGGNVDWRIVGAPVLDGAAPDLGVAVEPPATTPAAVGALLAWADVLVLPSRFEGVPLTVLEAQLAGCVVLATAVGAVGEAVTHGVDGLLVAAERDDAAIVADCVAALRGLAADPARLEALGAAAAARVASLDWATTMADWLERLDRAVPPR